MKRFEYRGKNLRLSRTEGLAARVSASKNGRGITVNSNHGLRLHQRLGKGFRAGWQNGRFQLIGRIKRGPFNWNISKSGVSGSIKNNMGTFNFLKPRFSSFNLAGINIRGKNAAKLHAIYFAIVLMIFFVKIMASVVLFIFWLIKNFLDWLIAFILGFIKSFQEDNTM